jgi:hypothetical protein
MGGMLSGQLPPVAPPPQQYPANWVEIFTKMTGTDPLSMGIKDPDTAQKVLIQMQQMYQMNGGGLPPMPQTNYGSVGTRNESQYPTSR